MVCRNMTEISTGLPVLSSGHIYDHKEGQSNESASEMVGQMTGSFLKFSRQK